MSNPADPSCPCHLKQPGFAPAAPVAPAGSPFYASAGLPTDPPVAPPVVYPLEMFYLRGSPTFDHVGSRFVAGTPLTLVGIVTAPGPTATPMRQGGLTMYQVRVPSGTGWVEGYAALSAADVASRTRSIASVLRADVTLPVRGPTHDKFWLRDVATVSHNAPDGRPYPVFPRGTIVDVIAPTSVSRGNLRVYQVRVPDGRTGFAAFTPRDLAGMRSYASTILRSAHDEFDSDLSGLGD